MRKFAAPGADEAVQSEDFAMVKGEGNVLVAARRREPSRFEHDARRIDLPLGDLGDPLDAADHERDKRLACHVRHRRASCDILAVAQNRNAVGDGEDFLQLVADEDDRDAVVAQLSEQLEEGGRLMLGDRGGRFVEQQNLGLAGQRLGDLDDLHLRHRQAAHFGARVDAGVEQIEIAARLPLDGAIVDKAVPGRQSLEQNVFPDAEARDEISLLMNRGDALAERIARRAELNRVAVQENAAGIGANEAGDDLDQRRFAGAVFAHQAMDFARLQVERNAVERLDAGEGFTDRFEREAHFRRSRC